MGRVIWTHLNNLEIENYPANHQTDDANNECDNHFDTNSIFNGFIIITLLELVTKFTRAS